MLFELSRASGIFQRVIDLVIRKHSSFAHSHIDVVLTFTEFCEERLKQLNYVLSDLEIFDFSVKVFI